MTLYDQDIHTFTLTDWIHLLTQHPYQITIWSRQGRNHVRTDSNQSAYLFKYGINK